MISEKNSIEKQFESLIKQSIQMEQLFDKEQESIWGKADFSWLNSGSSLALFRSCHFIELCYESYKALKEHELASLERYWEEAKQKIRDHEQRTKEYEDKVDTMIAEFMTVQESAAPKFDRKRLLLVIDSLERLVYCMRTGLAYLRKRERVLRVMVSLKNGKAKESNFCSIAKQ